ncbi:glutamine amidotransferase [Mariniluteicoccus endophyticus]
MGGMSRPFLLVGTRADDDIADAEHESFVRFMGVPAARLHRVRLEQEPLDVDLDAYAGIVVGGSPFNASDSEKSPLQQRVERDLGRMLDEVVRRDLPFFGACYGVGTLGAHQDAVIDRTYGEAPGAVTIMLTDEGVRDPLCAHLPSRFDAFVGHKEAVRTLPPHAVLLATGERCPVQMFRIRTNLYATQFHPELDAVALAERLRAYRDHGYFEPDELERLIAEANAADVAKAGLLLAAFAERYG